MELLFYADWVAACLRSGKLTRVSTSRCGTASCLAALLVCATTSCPAAVTLSQQIDPAEVNVGDPVIVTLTVQHGTLGQVQLPAVDGLQVNGTNLQIKSTDENGSISTSVSLNFSVSPLRPGDFTIPAFDIHTREGDVLHVHAMKLHVPGNASGPVDSSTVSVPPPDSPTIPAGVTPDPRGPVIMPPANAADASSPAANAKAVDADGAGITLPREPDGTPAKVFMIIRAATTDAYVGQAIPLRIDFFIRMDVYAEQNSLPTIKGSDFLMNSFTTRGQQSMAMIGSDQYELETWASAISAPKSGDFPLAVVRDTYWVKSSEGNNFDAFSNYFNRQANLAHQSISSNPLIIHVNPLPDAGRPAHFTGAIGQFQVAGDAHPDAVAVGEPVTLYFSVSGEGNFDYVRCPALPGDPVWKTYVPTSRTDYRNEARTNAVKTFRQSVIPQRNGTFQLPPATFSYFDPAAKQYVTVPVALPEITVTGSPVSTAPAPADGGATSSAAPPASGLSPNLTQVGSIRTSLVPVYRHSWFWIAQVVLLLLPLLGALFLLFRARSRPDDASAQRVRHQRSLRQEEDAMGEAARRGDALAFFIAARHAVQLQLGAQWGQSPEALTLREIRQRDPHLAGTLEPLFLQADEVIYSGHASPDLDLAQWEQSVRTELLQLQPA